MCEGGDDIRVGVEPAFTIFVEASRVLGASQKDYACNPGDWATAVHRLLLLTTATKPLTDTYRLRLNFSLAEAHKVKLSLSAATYT